MITTTENETTPAPESQLLVFKAFPAYAAFVCENHLVPYIQEQLRLSKVVKLPMLKYFENIPDDTLIEIGKAGHAEFLEHASKNKLQELLTRNLENWVKDQLVILGKEDLVADDIALASYIRKKALLKFLTLYTSDLDMMIEIVGEIDLYEAEASRAATETYINILQEKINKHSHFIESIANTTPNIIYVYDRVAQREIYTNRKVTEFLGYTPEDMEDMGANIIAALVHPEDRAKLIENEEDFETIADGEIRSIEYRIKDKEGNYRWMRAYESIFKRANNGTIIEKIGAAIDISEQKTVEEELLKREQQLIEAQEIAEMGSFILDLETNRMEVTPSYLRITGMPEDFSKADFEKKIHPADSEKFRKAFEYAVEQAGVYENEYRYNVNGREKVLWSKGVVFYKNGRKMLRGSLIDVTDRHRMIKQLQESENLYKQAQAVSHMGNWTWDVKKDLFHWSEEMYRIYGLEPGIPIHYEMVYAFNHPDDAERVINLIRTAIEQNKPYDFNYRIVLENGQEKIVQARGEIMRGESGNDILLGTLQDITERQQLIEQLSENQAFIQKIADVTPSIITTYNINTGKYLFVNQGMEKLLGYKPAQVLDEGVAFFLDIMHPEDLAMIMEKNNHAISEANQHGTNAEAEMVVEFKYRMRHIDGNYRWFHTYGTVFDRDEKGNVEHVLNVSVDVTEQEEAEQILHRKNIELQQSNTSLEEYAYVASHDLKEPLRKIATFGDRLLTSQLDRLNEDGKMYLEKMISSTRRMQLMINDLLSVSTIYGNKAYESASLQEIFNDVLQTLEAKIEEKSAKITTDGLPKAHVVPSQFRQLFQNLLSNSLKFTKDGVAPEINVSHKYLRQHDIAARNLAKSKNYVQIDLQDNGIGFDNMFANKIFTIFQRLHGRNEYEGTGIGLAICKKIAENHGGDIFANSKPGAGTTFSIIIPSI